MFRDALSRNRRMGPASGLSLSIMRASVIMSLTQERYPHTHISASICGGCSRIVRSIRYERSTIHRHSISGETVSYGSS